MDQKLPGWEWNSLPCPLLLTLAHMLARHVTATGLPARSVVTRLARLRPMARSLIAGAPPQRSMSQLDCQPPRLECCVPGCARWRSAITLRNSPFSDAASGTSDMTTGVENSD